MSFSDLEDSATEVAVVDAPAAPEAAPQESTELASFGGDAVGLTGEWEVDDISIPRINVVAKTGGLVDEGFNPGGLVLNKEVQIMEKDGSLNAIVLACDKAYQEDVEFGGDELPRVFRTKDEVHEVGGTTEWDGQGIRFRPKADIDMLIEAPAGLDEEALEQFPFENEGKHYAMVRLTAAKTAFSTSGGEIANAIAYGGGAPIWTKKWRITTKLKKRESNTWFVPVFKRTGRVDEATQKFVQEITQG